MKRINGRWMFFGTNDGNLSVGNICRSGIYARWSTINSSRRTSYSWPPGTTNFFSRFSALCLRKRNTVCARRLAGAGCEELDVRSLKSISLACNGGGFNLEMNCNRVMMMIRCKRAKRSPLGRPHPKNVTLRYRNNGTRSI